MAKRLSGIIAAAAVLVATSIQMAFAQESVKVRVVFVPAIPALAAWVAQDKGFFEAQHLDVTMTAVQNVAFIPAILAKQYDIGTATPVDLIKASAGGLNIAAVAGGHLEEPGHETNALVVRKDSGIKSVKDLAGKTIGSPSIGAILQTATLHWIVQEGVAAASVHFVEVPFPNMGDQMDAGRIDAATVAQPFADRFIKAGNPSLGNPLFSVANPALATVWIADRSWARANQPAVQRWSAGLRQAAAFIEQNPQDARQILVKYTKLPAPVIESMALPHFEPSLQPAELGVWIAVLRQLDQLQKPLDASTLLATYH
ncbi:MAG TPA: ABC transporter substrate-binding protein [Bradyrhizobium sp.]